MKLLELVLYQSCNYNCYHCPMKKWLYPQDDKVHNALTNDILFKWLDKYLDPKEWFIEITGGEPSLYPEIKSLIPNLVRRGYHGLIRTNGSGLIPKLPSFPIVSAWHKDKPFTKENYDLILILENPEDDWKAKEQYCIDNNIPHTVFPFTTFGDKEWKTTTTYPRKDSKYIKEMTTVFASGVISGCFTGAETEGINIQNMSEPVIVEFCRTCTNVEAIEYFIDIIPDYKDYLFSEIIHREVKHINYPTLTVDNKWVDLETGKVWGKLGDDINEINKQYRISLAEKQMREKENE